MKILFLCNKSPYPALEGGPMAMNSMIEGMIEAGHEVKVLAVNSDKFQVVIDDIPTTYQAKTGIELIHLDLRIKPFDAFVNLFTNKSYHVERFVSEDFRKRLIQILDSQSFDVVQLETLFMVPYLDDIRQHSKALVVLRAHNIEHLIWERIAGQTRFWPKKWYLRHLALTLKRFELWALKQVDGIAAITRKDAFFFKRYASCPVIDIPFGIDPAKYQGNVVATNWASLFHIGSMNWMPNEEGIKWFLENVWPEVNKRLPQTKLFLAGRYMPQWLLKNAFPNVEVVGEVDDAQEFVSKHGIAIVPLLSGSGIRIKIIEAMALGRAVITTEIGAEGIFYKQGENILIAERPDEFADAIEQLVNETDKAQQMGQKARQLIEKVYDHHKLIHRMIDFYKELGLRQRKLR